jgi:Prealbumin-like fold domain
MAAFNFHKRRTRRWWYAGVTLVVAALFAVVFVGGASANLTGSTFGGSDGNLTCNDANGALDWNCLTASGTPALHIGAEAFSGTQDNSFGQGTKENNSAVTLVQGSIPPNKSDLTVFYEASEQIGGYNTGCGTAPTPCTHTLIYLAWERSNVLGSANMDFEINQKATPCMDATSGFPVHCTINRTAKDILVTYDFTNGGGNPTVGLRTWNGSSWQTSTGVVSESAVNSGNVTDAVAGSPTNGTIAANEFGEAAIDLTASNVLSPGDCGFGQATTFLKSRSSASFTSEIKDFISPIPTPLIECKGAIKVVKEAKNHNCTGAGTSGNANTDATSCIAASKQALSGADFSIWQDTNSCAGLQTTDNEGDCTDVADTQVGSSMTTGQTGSGASAVASACFPDLTLGDYFVHEDSAPDGFATAADQTVTVTKGTCASGATAANFTVANSSADLPLTDLAVTASSVLEGASNSNISCTDGTNAIGNSPQPADAGDPPTTQYADPVTLNADSTHGSSLKPGTYTCTVVIDP